MSKQVAVEEERELHTNNLVPSLQKAQEYGAKQKQVKSAIAEAAKAFRPDPDQMSKCHAQRELMCFVRAGAVYAVWG